MIVLYKTAPTDSQTICSLINCCKRQTGLAEQLSVLIYDNSPSPQEPPLIKDLVETEYFHDGQNGGLAVAYNYALSVAGQKKIQWLLLLDQDTVLEDEFFETLFREITAQPPPYVCALVPKLVRDDLILSPQFVGKFKNKSVSQQFYGSSSQALTALNSAACLRVEAVIQVGGFPREFWLDYLDHVMFQRLQIAGGKIVTLDVVVEHRLSVLNLKDEISVERYANMLSAEWMYVRETGWVWGPPIHRLRLLKRATSLLIKIENRSYALQAFKYVFK